MQLYLKILCSALKKKKKGHPIIYKKKKTNNSAKGLVTQAAAIVFITAAFTLFNILRIPQQGPSAC